MINVVREMMHGQTQINKYTFVVTIISYIGRYIVKISFTFSPFYSPVTNLNNVLYILILIFKVKYYIKFF